MEKEAQAQEGQVKKPESLGEETLGSRKRSPAGAGALDGEAEFVRKAEKVRFSLVPVLLEDLTSEELTEFKLSLRDHPAGRGIPQKRLEEADGTKLAELLVAYHGELTAWRLAVNFQYLMLAKNLKRQARVVEGTTGWPDLQSIEAFTLIGETTQKESEKLQGRGDARKVYQEHMKEKFHLMRDRKSRPWEQDPFHHQFSQLMHFQYLHYRHCDQHELLHKSDMEDEGLHIDGSVAFDFYLGTGAQTHPVVLLGPAGIGKTTWVRKIILDWAEGKLYQERFHFVFYLSCRELNQLGDKETSFVHLIAKSNEWPGSPNLLTLIMMTQPERLLFIIDSLDELNFSYNEYRYDLCKSWNQQRPVPILLCSLLKKVLCPSASLLLIMRHTVLQKHTPLYKVARYVEILGFSIGQRKEYFCEFFEDKDLGKKVFRAIEGNSTLLTLCSLPLMTWIVCTSLKQQIERGQDPIQALKTATAFYVYSLSNLIPADTKNSKTQLLRGLCSLAAEGIWKRKLLFNEEDLRRHGLGAADVSAFLDMNIFQKDIDCENCYSFIHLSFQELFAAVFYVMLSAKERMECPYPSIPDVKNLLKKCDEDDGNFVVLVVRFLFGFLNAEIARELEKRFGCRMSPEIKLQLLRWVQKAIRRGTRFGYYNLPDWYSHLYETQNAEFVTQALVNLQDFTVHVKHLHVVLTALFCIKHAPGAQRIIFHNHNYDLPPDAWQVLFSVVSKNQNLKELTLIGYAPKFGNSGLEILCMELAHPSCKLGSLRLKECSFDSYDWKSLFFAIRKNQSMSKLDMKGSYLSDWDVKNLCSELSCSDHKLTRLRFDLAHDSENTRSWLQVLKKMKPGLIIDYPWENEMEISNLPHEKSAMASCIFPKKHQEPEPGGDISIPPNWRDIETFWGPVGLVPIKVVDQKRNIYSVHFPRAGSYHWPHTGLGFEVRGAVSIKIEFASWSQHLDWKQQQQPGSIVAGPLFDISAEPGLVAAVHLPHFVSLKEHSIDVSIFHVAHFKSEGIVFEKPDEVEAFCVILKDPDFSPMGVFLNMISLFISIPILSSTLIYHQVIGEEIRIHLYLIPDDISVRKIIDEEERSFQFLRLNKPPPLRALKLGSSYSVCGSEQLKINPNELMLKYRSHENVQAFSEIHTNDLQSEIFLNLKDQDGTVAWNVSIRPGEFVNALVLPDSPGSDFIQQHREQLIQRVTSLNSLLDKLYDKVLSVEEYDTVRVESTNQSKMRKLLSFSSSWNNDRKRLFIQALIELHPFLVTDLLTEQGTAGAQRGCLHRFLFL